RAVDPIAVKERAAPAEAGRRALGQTRDHLVEGGPPPAGGRRGLAHEVEEAVFGPLARRALGDDLLREHVERRDGRLDSIEPAAGHGAHQGRALDELVARRREEAPARRAAQRVTRPADALEERGHGARRAHLTDEVDRPDVDAELERGGRGERSHLASLEPLLDAKAAILREAPVVGADALFAEAFAQV